MIVSCHEATVNEVPVSDVFILGAGFSKAVHKSMPLLSELSEEVGNRLDPMPHPLPRLGNNLELWLTYLSQRQPWLREQHNLRNRALFLEITEKVRDVMDDSTELVLQRVRPMWLDRLVSWWHRNGSTVVTLNYDTLIERAAGNIEYDEGSNLMPNHLYPVTLTEARRRDAMVLSSQAPATFTLYKLHGSVNWYYSGSPSFSGEVIYYSHVAPWGSDRQLEEDSKDAATDKVPLIVPPTAEKSTYFQHETLRQIWATASQALWSATRVYCLGYSLPITDLGVRFFLQHAGPIGQRQPLHIVNKRPDVLARYRELLGEAYEVDHAYSGQNAIETFVDALVK